MPARPLSMSLSDLKTAHRLVLDCLPSAAMWRGAVASRRDGSSPDGIFAVIEALRSECLARIGDLSDQRALEVSWPLVAPDQTWLDRVTGYRLAIESLPRPDLWHTVIGLRCDGSTPEGVFAAVAGVRHMLHACLSDLYAVADSTHSPASQRA